MKLYLWDWGNYPDQIVVCEFNKNPFGTVARAKEQDAYPTLQQARSAAREDLNERKAHIDRVLVDLTQTPETLPYIKGL